MWKSNQNILPQKKTLTKCFVHLPCWFSIWCFVSIFISKEVLTVWFLFWSRMKAKFPNITLSFEAEITIPYLVPAGGAGWSQHTGALTPGAVGNMTLVTAPSHLTSGAMLTLSLLPSHFIVPDGEGKRILWQLIKCQDLILSLAVLYSQLGKCLFSPQQHWLEPGLQVKTLAQRAVWLWVCDTPHTPRASPEPTQGWGFTAGPPLPIHVNDSFILDFRELRLSPTHHPAGNSVSTRIWLTDSPAPSVTQRCHKQGQHSSDHTRMSENAYKEEGEEMMLNDLQRVRHYGEPVKSKR